MNKKIKVLGTEIALSSKKKEDYISLTDIARYKNSEHPADVIKNWTRSKDTIEFLGLWERINNPDFKLVEFDSLEFRQVITLLCCLLKNGLKQLMHRELYQILANMAAPLRIKISHLNLHHGFLQNLSYT